MKPKRRPFDAVGKKLIRAFFVEFLDAFFPDIASRIEPGSVRLEDKDLPQTPDQIKGLIPDLLFSARYQGRKTGFLVHIELQNDRWRTMATRMAMVTVAIASAFEMPVVPILLYTGESPKKAIPDCFKVEFGDEVILTCHFRVLQLNRLSWKQYLHTHNPAVIGLMTRMGVSQAEAPRVKAECLRLAVGLNLPSPSLQTLVEAVDTYLKLDNEGYNEFEEYLESFLDPERKTSMTVRTTLKEHYWKQGLEEGLQQGLERGRLEGEQRGALSPVLRLLAKRIGTLSTPQRQSIEALNCAQLETLSEAVLDFTCAQDLARWLANHRVH